MEAGVQLSVVVAVHNGECTLRGCLEALLASRGVRFQVIVVDDGSTDGSGQVASLFPVERVRLDRRAGAAAARNRGAKRAVSPVLVFVDADVQVAPDTLRRIHVSLQEDPGLAALFGSYSDRSPHADFFSQYKNLHHHFIHQTSRADASTFWTGCGAIRREVFREMGGFSPQGKPGPDLADMELGYRMTALGHRIALLPDLQVIHDKRYTFFSLIRSDLWFRAVPWTRLMWQKRIFRRDLNTRGAHVASVLLLYLCMLSLPLPLSAAGKMALWLVGLAGVTWLNRSWVLFCRSRRGMGFAAKAAAMEWLYFLYSGFGALAGTLLHFRDLLSRWGGDAEAGKGPPGRRPEGSYLPARLARHKGEVTLRILRDGWGKRGPATRVLKTDLYEEAFGEDQILLRPEAPWRGLCVGIDVRLPVVKRALANGVPLGVADLRGVCADLRRLPFRPRTFDLVLSISTLDHLFTRFDLEESLGEINRVSSAAASLFITMDNPWNPWVALRNVPVARSIFRKMGLLRVSLGRTAPWPRMAFALRPLGWEMAALRHLLGYPRAVLILLSRTPWAHWDRLWTRGLALTDRLCDTFLGRIFGLYYAVWFRRIEGLSNPKKGRDP